MTDQPAQNHLAAVARAAEEFLHLPDVDGLTLAIATAVAAESDMNDEPLWMMAVNPPSTSKTEGVRALSKVTNVAADTFTTATLLHWEKRGKLAHPAGLLPMIGPRGLLTIADLSTLLTSDSRTAGEVFSQFRRVYDGAIDRGTSPPVTPVSGARLQWAGRIGIYAACTSAIDRFSLFGAELGSRWLLHRAPLLPLEQRRAASRKARRQVGAAARETLSTKVADAVYAGRDSMPWVVVPDAVSDEIEDAALVLCIGRGAVPRTGYGAREITGAPEVEGPGRVTRSMNMLARALLSIGVDPGDVTRLCRAVALDTMPADRRRVLSTLCEWGQLTTASVAKNTRIHDIAPALDRKVTRFALEDLEQTGAVEGIRVGSGDDDDESDRATRARLWQIANTDEGDLIRAVFKAAKPPGPGWDEV